MIAAQFAGSISVGPATAHTGVEEDWQHLKESVCGAAENAVGFKRFTRQPWITSSTLEIVDQRRAAWLAHDLDEYRALNPLRNAALQRDRQAWADGIADAAELAIQQGRTHDAFKGIKRLKSGGPSTSAPIKGWMER